MFILTSFLTLSLIESEETKETFRNLTAIDMRKSNALEEYTSRTQARLSPAIWSSKGIIKAIAINTLIINRNGKFIGKGKSFSRKRRMVGR